MMRRIVFAALLVFSGFAAVPAYADPIPLDPFVGVRGGDGSIPDSDLGFHKLGTTGCEDISKTLGVSAFCQTFDIVTNVFDDDDDYYSDGRFIESLTLAFTELGGFGLENQFLSSDPSGFNELGGFVPQGAFEVTLFEQIMLLSSSYYSPSGIPCNEGSGGLKDPFCTIQIYLYPKPEEGFRGPYAVSIRAINGVTIDETPIPAPVPEPGTLLLMGTGIAGLAARRLRRRSN